MNMFSETILGPNSLSCDLTSLIMPEYLIYYTDRYFAYPDRSAKSSRPSTSKHIDLNFIVEL